MRVFGLLSVFFFSGISLASSIPYQLPVQVFCDSRWFYAKGGFICSQIESMKAKIKVNIPQVKGQFRATNCNRDLTEDGNPDDFNNTTWESGFWLWRRQNIRFGGSPLFETTELTEKDSNCAISVVVTGENSGTQKSAFLYKISKDMANRSLFEYSCSEKNYSSYEPSLNSYGKGVGFCKALSDSLVKLKIHTKWNNGVVSLVSTGCGISENIKFTPKDGFPSSTKEGRLLYIEKNIYLKNKFCVLDIMVSSLEQKPESGTLVLIGEDRERAELDNPVITQDGNKYSAYRPIGADIFSVEIYKGQGTVWRSGSMDKDKITFDLNGGDKICSSAYSAKKNSSSFSCYKLNPLQEVPYEFY